MFVTHASTFARVTTRTLASRQSPFAVQIAKRTMVAPTLGEAARDASYAWSKSCYSGIDFSISDESSVYEAVEKFAAYNVGCLATKDADGELSSWIVFFDGFIFLGGKLFRMFILWLLWTLFLTLYSFFFTRKTLRCHQRTRLCPESCPIRQTLPWNESKANFHQSSQPRHRISKWHSRCLHAENVDQGH